MPVKILNPKTVNTLIVNPATAEGFCWLAGLGLQCWDGGFGVQGVRLGGVGLGHLLLILAIRTACHKSLMSQ